MTLAIGDMAARLCAELPGALRGGQVVGYFQPEVELSTGRPVAAELLARWEHPELGILEPGLFVPLIEQLGLMDELSRRMVRQALAQHRAWVRAGWALPVSVNIGPDCVADPAFPGVVARILREEQVPGQMLALEVSEETGTAAATTRFFAELAEFGVRVSLDDFGTGFASLQSLGDWPVNELKLDSSIVRPMVASASFRTIVRTAVSLAYQLGLTVVAEGVDSEAVSSELRALGCDIGQGFLLGRPMPAAAFADWLRERDRLVPRLDAVGYPRAVPPVTGEGGAARRVIRAARRAVDTVGAATLSAAVAVLAAYGLWQIFRWGGTQHRPLIGGLVFFFPVQVWAMLLGWRVVRRTGLDHRSTRAWRLVFAGFSCYLLGDVPLLAYRSALYRTNMGAWAVAATLGAYVLLGSYTLMFWGLVTFPAPRRTGAERQRLVLDVGTVATAGAVLIWYLAVGPVLAHGVHPDLATLATLVYPLGDLLLLFGILSVLWRGAPRSSVLALRIFVAGSLFLIGADLIRDWVIAHGGYRPGNPLDVLYMLALLTTSVAFATQLRASPSGGRAAPSRPPSARPAILPYLAIAGSYLLLGFVGLSTVRSDSLSGVLIGVVALSLLISFRQYTALHDYGRLAARYQELAMIDGTTGLYNRRHLMETAEAALAHAQRLGLPFAALMIDVDHFKAINDMHGHAIGDQVLAELAMSCREQVRPGDIVGRYGGDEFVITIPGIARPRVIQLAYQLTRPDAHVLRRAGHQLSYTVSAGIAECPPGSDLDLPTLLIRADLAMYEAKQAGGGGLRVFGETGGAIPASP